MTADVQRELAEKLAEKFTSPHGARNPDWDWEQPDGPDNPYHLPVEMPDRINQSPYVVFTAGDGCSTIRMPSCTELTEALLPTVQALIADAEKRAAARELRAIGRAGLATSPGAHPVRVPVSYLFDRAAALDPSGADSGEGR